MRNFPVYPDRFTRLLDGAWDFAWLGDAIDVNAIVPSLEVFNEIAAVPGCFDTAGERIGRRGVGLYRKWFHFPAGRIGQELSAVADSQYGIFPPNLT